ncbi:type II secretion system protein [Patescibacteria group bacterium]|nr:type II secretion system protein [Patescibacteria group bacterium]
MISVPKKQRSFNNQRGFSLVEFVVVLTIFAIMSSVSLFNYNAYRDRIQETNVGQDIALSIRQAQIYGLSSSDRLVGDQNLDEAGVADDVFGVNSPSNPYFTTQIADITQDRSIRGVVVYPSSETILIFEDLNRNLIYDDGTDRIIDRRSIQTPSVDLVGVDLCDTAANCGDVEEDRVDIVFVRPYPEAFISRDGSASTLYNFGSMVFDSGRPNQSYVEVTSIGNVTYKQNYEVD